MDPNTQLAIDVARKIFFNFGGFWSLGLAAIGYALACRAFPGKGAK